MEKKARGEQKERKAKIIDICDVVKWISCKQLWVAVRKGGEGGGEGRSNGGHKRTKEEGHLSY